MCFSDVGSNSHPALMAAVRDPKVRGFTPASIDASDIFYARHENLRTCGRVPDQVGLRIDQMVLSDASQAGCAMRSDVVHPFRDAVPSDILRTKNTLDDWFSCTCTHGQWSSS